MSASRVLAGLAAFAAALALAGPAAAAPLVEAMVAGRGGIVVPATRVRAAATSVAVAGRHCSVAAATPLAALLAATTRAPALSIGLHDYGHCASSPADSGQLFVNALGGERNVGQDGWVYKVDRLTGTTGAADTSGPRGDGRGLASGQRVLWFWCVAHAGGCQRTLALTLARTSPAPGAKLNVGVVGYDDRGRGVPVVGANVSLGAGGAHALSGPGGVAILRAPAHRGRYVLSASRARLVPSFPETLVVR